MLHNNRDCLQGPASLCIMPHSMPADVDSHASLPDVEFKKGPLHLLDSVQEGVAGGNDLQPNIDQLSIEVSPRLNAVTLLTAVLASCLALAADQVAADERPQQQDS